MSQMAGAERVVDGDGRDQRAGDDTEPLVAFIDPARVTNHQDKQQTDPNARVQPRLADADGVGQS